jgi:hypothetical protein
VQEPAGDLLEHPISRLVAEGVVHVLELVDVHEDNARLLVAPAG